MTSGCIDIPPRTLKTSPRVVRRSGGTAMSELPKARSAPFSRRQLLRTFGLAWLEGRTLLGTCPLSVATWAAGREVVAPQKITSGGDKTEMAKLVRAEFLHAWNGCKKKKPGDDMFTALCSPNLC